MHVVYDAGVLVAADRRRAHSDRGVWALHKALLQRGIRPVTTAPVVAQVSRDTRSQVNLGRLLAGCVEVAFDPGDSRQVGALLAMSSTSDVVDAHLVVHASRYPSATILTGDPDDLRRLAGHLTNITIDTI